jgi:hypothetical protein
MCGCGEEEVSTFFFLKKKKKSHVSFYYSRRADHPLGEKGGGHPMLCWGADDWLIAHHYCHRGCPKP